MATGSLLLLWLLMNGLGDRVRDGRFYNLQAATVAEAVWFLWSHFKTQTQEEEPLNNRLWFLLLCFMFVRACLELPQLLILNETRGRSPANTFLPQHARKTCVHLIVCFYDPRIKSEVKSQGVVLSPSSFKKHRESDPSSEDAEKKRSMPLFSHAYIFVMSFLQVEKKNWSAATRPNLSSSDFNRKIYISTGTFTATCIAELEGFFKLRHLHNAHIACVEFVPVTAVALSSTVLNKRWDCITWTAPDWTGFWLASSGKDSNTLSVAHPLASLFAGTG